MLLDTITIEAARKICDFLAEVERHTQAFFNIVERSLENSLFAQRGSLEAYFVRCTILAHEYLDCGMSLFGLVNVDAFNGVCTLL